jgi:hypothetical protein
LSSNATRSTTTYPTSSRRSCSTFRMFTRKDASRLVYGIRTSLLVGLVAVIVATLLEAHQHRVLDTRGHCDRLALERIVIYRNYVV